MVHPAVPNGDAEMLGAVSLLLRNQVRSLCSSPLFDVPEQAGMPRVCLGERSSVARQGGQVLMWSLRSQAYLNTTRTRYLTSGCLYTGHA